MKTVSVEAQRLIDLCVALREFAANTGPVQRPLVEAEKPMMRLNMSHVIIRGECWSSCCAIGLAALHPKFPELQPAEWYAASEVRIKATGVDGEELWTTVDWYDDDLIRYFGLTEAQHDEIFNPEFYDDNPTEEQVIERIRRVLRESFGVCINPRSLEVEA